MTTGFSLRKQTAMLFVNANDLAMKAHLGKKNDTHLQQGDGNRHGSYWGLYCIVYSSWRLG